ncbi:MAG: OmpA family protein [Bacteroidota bacterium]
MKRFTKSLLLIGLLLSVVTIQAQKKSSSTSKKTTKESKAKKSSSAAIDSSSAAADSARAAAKSASNDTSKLDERKDPQNQIRFMKPDMESPEYNFYEKKRISTPLMMRYDLDSAIYQKDKKKIKQQKSYLERQYHFPAKPKDAWELGVNFGAAYMSGDVKPYTQGIGIVQNIGAGFTVRKALGYTLSIRGGYNFMMMTGRNWEADGNIKFNQALRGVYDPRVDYYTNPALSPSNTITGRGMNTLYFHNYRTMMHEVHLEGLVNLGNIRYHKERSIVSFYALAGVSAFLFNTKTDALDDNGNVHDFSEAFQIYETQTLPPGVDSRTSLRKAALDKLKGVFDGKYESQAEARNNVTGLKYWQFIPTVTLGMGLQFHVSKWVTLGLEQRFILTQEDLLDGYRWTQDEYASFTPNSDNISYTSLSLNFHLGLKKRTEPMYWLNPIHYSYRKISEIDPKAIAEELFKDDDGDGVPNRLDKEPNTKTDCPTDVKGVALDSDHDGIIDCLDKEPYSPPSYPIDSNGVAIIPPNPCCDTVRYSSDPQHRNGFIDDDNNIIGPDGTVYPPGTDSIIGADGKKVAVSTLPKGKPQIRRGGGGGAFDCSKIDLPEVIFENEKYYIDPQFYGNMHQIAERMQMCPDMKLVVTGMDESRNDQKFNEQLSWNRANAAVDYMVEKYGISRDRYIVKYKGGKKAAIGTPFEKKMKNKVEFRYANDGEGGDSNPPAPHPGLKAGSNK